MPFDDTVAASYEAWYLTPEGLRTDRYEKAVLSWALGHYPRAGSILEVGCGTAHFTRWFADRGLETIGLDLSPAMLAQARSAGPVRVLCADACRLPFPDRAFDLTALITALEFVDEPLRALAEALRVARTGVVLGVLHRWSALALQRRVEAAVRPTVFRPARFYGVRELERLARSASDLLGDRPPPRFAWRTTLPPRWWPRPQGGSHCGAFVAMALLLEETARHDAQTADATTVPATDGEEARA